MLRPGVNRVIVLFYSLNFCEDWAFHLKMAVMASLWLQSWSMGKDLLLMWTESKKAREKG